MHLVGGTISVHDSVFGLLGGMTLAPWPLWQSNGTKNTYFQESSPESSPESRSSPGNSASLKFECLESNTTYIMYNVHRIVNLIGQMSCDHHKYTRVLNYHGNGTPAIYTVIKPRPSYSFTDVRSEDVFNGTC